jgi:hypothetical protein
MRPTLIIIVIATMVLILPASSQAQNRSICREDYRGNMVCNYEDNYGRSQGRSTCKEDYRGNTICDYEDNYGRSLGHTTCQKDYRGRVVCESSDY